MILATFFLVSFTGIRLLIHHCMACETTDISLISYSEDCCEHHEQHHSKGEHAKTCAIPQDDNTTCCAQSGQCGMDENCCKDEVIYLAKDYELSHDRQTIRVEAVMVAIHADLNFLSLFNNLEKEFFTPHNYAEPPPRNVGKDFILFTHQIKIG